jgi:hypothetical protein
MDYFHFRDFTPSDSLRSRANRTIQKIMELAPSDANITALLEAGQNGYHCAIEVAGQVAHFSAVTSHQIAQIALDKAELSILRKLDKWHKSRPLHFTQAPTGIPIRMGA